MNNIEINIPAGASEVTLKTAGKYCDKDIRVKTHFRIESGTHVVPVDVGSLSSVHTAKLDCMSGAKLLVLQADNNVVGEDGKTTYKRITDTEDDGEHKWTVGVLGNCISKVGDEEKVGNRCYMPTMITTYIKYGDAYYDVYAVAPNDMPCDNTDGFSFSSYGLKAGRYNWTAYYWDE